MILDTISTAQKGEAANYAETENNNNKNKYLASTLGKDTIKKSSSLDY